MYIAVVFPIIQVGSFYFYKKKYMLIIRVKENESIDRAIRRYRRKVQNTGLIKEYRRKQVYLKPSTKRRTQIEKAKYKEQMLRRFEDA